MNFFWIDEQRRVFKSYDDLVSDLNQIDTVRTIIQESDPYRFFLYFVHSIICKREVVLLDSDLTEIERSNLHTTQEEELRVVNLCFADVNSVIQAIQDATEWRAGIFTSGTSGKPKKVIHSMETLTKFVGKSRSLEGKTWAFCYNYSHIAGLHVFLQALMNRNVIVYVSDIDRTLLNDVLIRHGVTHISATPTFYRSALAYLKHKVPSVQRVLFGGERFDDKLAKHLFDVFVNAKMKNIYASTEAGSMLSSTGKKFVIPDNLHGEIQISPYDGELLIRREVLAGFSVQEEASSEGEWYHTGDLVRYVSETEFEFIGRKTEMINVGGYKVNPHEVEEEIRKISGVKDAIITFKPNALVGQMLIAEILKEDAASEAAIEKSVTHELPLQAWKIPRIVNFVDEIKISRTGKLVR